MFYCISGAYSRNAVTVDVDHEYDEYEAFQNIEVFKNFDKKFTISKGEKFYDVVQLRYDLFNFLISERMKNVLEANGIIGYEFLSTPIQNTEEAYYLLHITGKAGQITNLHKLNKLKASNREFNIKTCDGSDIFNLKGSAVIACTQNVKELLEREQISNINIEPL